LLPVKKKMTQSSVSTDTLATVIPKDSAAGAKADSVAAVVPSTGAKAEIITKNENIPMISNYLKIKALQKE
jgi:hypothetical protein